MIYTEFYIILPEIYFITIILSIVIFGVIFNNETKTVISGKNNIKVLFLSKEITFLIILSLAFTSVLVIINPYSNSLLFNNFFILDSIASSLKLIILLATIGVLFIGIYTIFVKIKNVDYSQLNSTSQNNSIIKSNFSYGLPFEYPVLIGLATFGLIILISSNDFLSLYLTIELASLCFYILAAFKRSSELSTEAGLKYFILGAFASGILLYGISLVYGFTGLTNFNDLFLLVINNNEILGFTTLSIGLLFILVGFIFKLAAAPFHIWIPDVYEGSLTSVTSYFAIVPKIVFLGVVIRFTLGIGPLFIEYWQLLFLICSILSLGIGTFVSLYQKNLKRFLAYGAVTHIGYLLMAIAIGSSLGYQAVFIYIVIYIVASFISFGVILSLVSKKEGVSVNLITELSGLAKKNVVLAITLALAFFSIAGVPPLAGFYSKYYIFIATIQGGYYYLAIFGVVISVIGAVYYLRFIKLIFFDNINIKQNDDYLTISKFTSIILGLALFFLVFFFLYPKPFFFFIYNIVLDFVL